MLMKQKVFSIFALLLMAATQGAWAQAEALINGLFTINAEGNQVVFAQGNLQAVCTSADGDASTQETFTWRFAEHQWDYIGGNYSGGAITPTGNNFIDGSGSVSAAGTVDLFSWVGESSALTGVAAYGICLWGLGGNNPEDGLKSDWGNLFGDDWHALSKDEWDYIFNTRSTTSGVRYAKATVNGVAGVILLPDDWSTSYYTLASTNTSTAAFGANSINSTNWTNSLEAHGAVFLPAGGSRSFGNIYNQNTYGFYWSNSPDSEDGNKASLLIFHAGDLQTQYTENRGYGFSVRLVKNVRIDVTGVTLNASTTTLAVGGTTTLTPTFTPSNATNKNVTWSSSNTSVATVDANGVVTAQGLGTATITATATNGTADTSDDLTATCTVTVAVPINALSEVGTVGAFTDVNGQTRLGIVTMLNGSKYAISMSNETDISGLSGASTGKIGDITYYSNADALAKFANNQNEYTAVNVWRLPTSTEFDALAKLGGAWDGTTGHTGWTWTIGTNTLFLPKSGYYEGGGIGNSDWGYYWSSTSYPNMFVFASGYAAQIGNGGITAGMPLRLFCQIPYVNVTGVTLAQTEGVLTVGETLTLTATIAPINATDKSVTWTSSDASVATVDANGVVTARGLGTATITATATNGTADTSDDLTTTCAVTVATPITAASADGTVGVFTDANGQSRLGIVVTLSEEKYAIAMSNETDLTGLSGTYTKKDGNYTYYNFADACAKFANNQTDGSYTASNVWRLPTAAEFTALANLGGSWNGTGYTWTIGGNSLFLPAAGYNDAPPVSGVGYYWSSTQPQFLYFNNGGISMPNGGTQTGMPLRLFCQLPPIPSITFAEDDDNSTALNTADGNVYNVTLTRTLQAGGWNTFCAPFNTATPDGWTVKELTGSAFNSTTGELTLSFGAATSIEAGKPYLVKVDNNVVNPVFEGVTVSNTTATTETSAVDFVPVMNPTNLTGGDKTVLFVTGGNKLTYPSDDGNINGFRAYFQLKGESVSLARAFRMSFDDNVTGITTVISDEPTTANGTYTLDGRRIEGEPTQKGVYIVNGKKIIIK